MKRLRAIAAIAAVSVAIVGATAGPAAAHHPASSGRAVLNSVNYLTATPNSSTPPSSPISRAIWLDEGMYLWTENMRRIDSADYHTVREIYLTAGTYHWQCQLQPGFYVLYWGYNNVCSLQTWGGTAAYHSGWHFPDMNTNWAWGGHLQRK